MSRAVLCLAALLTCSWPSASIILPRHSDRDTGASLPVLAADGARDEVYHLHIPKVAGLSFGLDSMDVLEPHGLHTISREGCYSDQSDNPHLRGIMVLFRRPRSLLRSMHGMCEAFSIYLNGIAQEGDERLPKFGEWIEAWADLQKSGFHGNFTPQAAPVTGKLEEMFVREARMRVWEDPPFVRTHTSLQRTDWPQLDGGGTLWQHGLLPFNCYNPRNPMVHRLTCRRPQEYPEAYDVDLAVRNMQSTSYVGLLEVYQSSLCLLHSKVDSQMPSYCDCEDEAAWKSFSEALNKSAINVNVTQDNMPVDDYPEAVLEKVDYLTSEDVVLYRAVWERFVREVREVEMQRGMKIFCPEKMHLKGGWQSTVEAMMAAQP